MRLPRFVAPLLQSGLCRLYALVYRRWLWSDFYQKHARVIRVRSWRTALIEEVGRSGKPAARKTITPCFWGLT